MKNRLCLPRQSSNQFDFNFIVYNRYHVDLLVSLLKCFNLFSVGVYGKMDQLARKEQLSEVSILLSVPHSKYNKF